MAIFNDVTNELLIKVAYVGASRAGKTTNLQSLYKQHSPEVKSRFFDLHGLEKKSPYFEFLPLSIGDHRSIPMRLNIFTLPAIEFFGTLERQILRGVDGIVMVIDSRLEHLDENERCSNRLETLLAGVERSIESIPIVVQLNHRDAPGALSLSALKKGFTWQGCRHIEAVAVQDVGVTETIEMLSDLMLERMDSATLKTVYQEHPQFSNATNRPESSHQVTNKNRHLPASPDSPAQNLF